ncbi:MAG: hypothetical protein JJU24_18450 [Natronohydrobacter sp.]|nr:hypothetical protein [Natronohydrobacter sp.]
MIKQMRHLWFLPGPLEDEPDFLPPGPRSDPSEATLVDDWKQAEAGLAARLAHVAGKLGALDDRLLRSPEGWRHRLALMEATELSWFAGDRIGADRLALWVGLRLSGVQDDAGALASAGWSVRRLTSGPGPEAGLAEFLGRHEPDNKNERDTQFSDRAEGWSDLMEAAQALHPISRACMGYHLWSLAGLDGQRGRTEAAITAARFAVGQNKGAFFAPLAMGGAGGLRASGTACDRLNCWLDGMEAAILTAMRQLDDIEAWDQRAQAAMAKLSGRTPPALRCVLTDWPLISAPMAEELTGASRAAVQRNLEWMEARGLIREVTGQGRFRMWRVAS